jgi:NitT/TauT family transport system permease protein
VRRLVNRRPDRFGVLSLGLLPFVLVVATYLAASGARLRANPDDKLLPSLGSYAEAVHRLAVEEDARTGAVLLWADTWASLRRLGLALALSAAAGLAFGLALGVVPYARAALSPFVAAFSMVPPLAILPILFIVFGLGEAAKVALMVIGVAPVLVRDLALRAQELPAEQLVKAQTLGASTWQLVVRVVLPQLWPRLVDALRLTLGSAWLFLIAAEAIASTEGLGYRIFLVRRYMSMEVILPYVAWITLLAFAMDAGLRRFRARAFAWAEPGG